MKVRDELLQLPRRGVGVCIGVARMFKFLLNMWMDQVDTLHVGKYWSEVLCYTIMTHLSDLEFKVTDFESLC